jgi:CDP-diglyceride synthetase
MRILVIEMIYLFEYDDNEEDMIYEIANYRYCLSQRKWWTILFIEEILWYMLKNMFLSKCNTYKTTCHTENTIDLFKHLIDIWRNLLEEKNNLLFNSSLVSFVFCHTCWLLFDINASKVPLSKITLNWLSSNDIWIYIYISKTS